MEAYKNASNGTISTNYYKKILSCKESGIGNEGYKSIEIRQSFTLN